MTLDNIDPGAAATSRLVKPKIASPYIAPTSPTAVVLGQLAAGTVILANGMLDKRRERAAQKTGIIPTPSPS